MYRFYKITLLTALIAACSALVTTAITAEPRSIPVSGENSSIVIPTNSTGILSQCGDYFTFNPSSDYYGVVPDEYKKDSIPVPKMITPVFGFMVDVPFDTDKAMKVKRGENPYQTGAINRALWEGHTFIWVNKTVEQETYNFVKSYSETWNSTHSNKVIPLTWTDSKRGLPMGRDFAFSSWNISQSCMSFSEEAFEEFMAQSIESNAGRDVEEPPMAKLLADGSLPNINKQNENKR